MIHNLSKSVKIIRVMNAVAAGTTNQTSSTIDTLGYTGCLLLAACGTISASAVTTLSAQESKDDGSSDAYTAITGATSATYTPTTDNNKMVALDINRPRKRYVQAVVNRATGNAVIDGVFAVLYNGNAPVVDDASLLSKVILDNPADASGSY